VFVCPSLLSVVLCYSKHLVMNMYCPSSPMSLEAQKLISVSIGKINASRVTRTGSSLHKSLLVASVLHKARNVYLDEEREKAMRFSQCPPIPPQVTVTPVLPSIPQTDSSDPDRSTSNSPVGDNGNNRLQPELTIENNAALPDRIENRLPAAEANTGNNVTRTTTTTTTVTSFSNISTTTTTSDSISGRKRRRISDQETEAAISSILPKKLRTDESLEERVDISLSEKLSEEVSSQVAAAAAAGEEEEETSIEDKELNVSSEDSDSDNEDSASDTSTSSGSGDEMEVDKLTSLVSYFSFSKSQKQNEFCIEPIHSSTPILALTA